MPSIQSNPEQTKPNHSKNAYKLVVILSSIIVFLLTISVIIYLALNRDKTAVTPNNLTTLTNQTTTPKLNSKSDALITEKSTGEMNHPKVTVEFYEDFQCPGCKYFDKAENAIIEKYKGKSVKFVFKQFPLNSIHKYAEKAAEASEFANQYGLFWEYKKKLMATEDLSNGSIITIAEEVGLDGEELKQALLDDIYKDNVTKDIKDGEQKDLQSTPSIFVDGILIEGSNLDEMATELDREIQQKL
jgi:protein-disulfide isomerase